MIYLANFYIVNVIDEILVPLEKESKLLILRKAEILKKLLPYQKEAIKLFLNKKCIDLF